MASQTNASLPEGLDIHGYRIVRKIATGGFSIVYLAAGPDGRPVALKEYLPANLVHRQPGELTPQVDARHLPTYRHGLRSFFEEGRALARIRHPNVVHVLDFFRAHETAYLVMAYEHGRTLQDLALTLRRRGQALLRPMLPELALGQVFVQIMAGLRQVHANRLLHLDIKPANIYLRQAGPPMLLDFGAARQSLSDDAPKLFPMYTPGFAAPELYARSRSLGPWTDIYGLGASMFAAMTGTAPQPADQRASHDKMQGILSQLAGAYSRRLIDLVAWCLRLDPLERPQSVFTAQRALDALAEANASNGATRALQVG